MEIYQYFQNFIFMKNYLNTIIIGVTILISVILLSGAFKHRNQELEVISVTGLGSKDFESDLVVWSGNFSRKTNELKSAYAELNRDQETIRKYLLQKGMKSEDIVFSAIEIAKEYDNTFDSNGNIRGSVFTGYRLSQQITIESKEVDKVEKISREISELINTGVELYSQPPAYYYTQLSALKLEMIGQATKDAKDRAEQIAENAGGSLGKLKEATMGIFQITARNSEEDYSWGGTYNTTARRKTANITMKLKYAAH